MIWVLINDEKDGRPLSSSDSEIDLIFLQISSVFTNFAYHVSLLLGAIKAHFGQNWKPRIGEILLLFSNDPKGSFRCMNQRQSTHHTAFDQPVKLHWWTCGVEVIGYNRGLEPGILWSCWAERPNHSTSTHHHLLWRSQSFKQLCFPFFRNYFGGEISPENCGILNALWRFLPHENFNANRKIAESCKNRGGMRMLTFLAKLKI
jgi:hypothetical protein